MLSLFPLLNHRDHWTSRYSFYGQLFIDEDSSRSVLFSKGQAIMGCWLYNTSISIMFDFLTPAMWLCQAFFAHSPYDSILTGLRQTDKTAPYLKILILALGISFCNALLSSLLSDSCMGIPGLVPQPLTQWGKYVKSLCPKTA